MRNVGAGPKSDARCYLIMWMADAFWAPLKRVDTQWSLEGTVQAGSSDMPTSIDPDFQVQCWPEAVYDLRQGSVLWRCGWCQPSSPTTCRPPAASQPAEWLILTVWLSADEM